MIKEKYIPYLAVGVVILSILLVVAGVMMNTGGFSEITNEPEYMSKLFDKDKVLEINVDIDEADWEELKENAQQELYYKANITIDGKTYNNVGIRAKGNSSLNMVASSDSDRYSFKIKMDEYVSGQNAYGLDKFVLNNMIGDATYMKEYFSYDMFESMGIATPGFAFANITLNGEPWGVYLAVEALEEDFVERSYGSTDGNLYKVEGMNMGGGNKGGGMKKPEEGGMGVDRPVGEPPEGIGNTPKFEENLQMADDDSVQNVPQSDESQGEVPPELPSGESMQGEARPELPTGEQIMDNENLSNVAEENDIATEGLEVKENQVDSSQQQSNNRKADRGMGGMGSSGGANLVYIDDEISSYSSIFDYTILKTTTDTDKQRLISIIKNLNEGTNLEESIDVEEVLKYFAVNTFLVNLDSYASNMKHNFYLYENNGQLQILPWDFNLSFGAYQTTNASSVINFPIDTPVTDSMENSPLISKLLEVPEYKTLYHEYLEQLVNDYIISGKFETAIESVNSLISEYVKNDATAFYTYDEYTASLPQLIQFGKDRAKSILAQLAGEQPTDDYGDISTTVNLIAMGTQMGGGGKGQATQDTALGEKSQEPEGVGINKESQGMNSNGIPLDRAVIEEAMGIISQLEEGEELTEEMKNELANLGITDEQIEFIGQMRNGPGGGFGGEKGGMPGESAVNTTQNKMILGASIVTLIIGLIFIISFKRKKFRS